MFYKYLDEVNDKFEKFYSIESDRIQVFILFNQNMRENDKIMEIKV